MKKFLALVMALCMALTMVGAAMAEENVMRVWVGSDQDQAWIDSVIEGFMAANPDAPVTIKTGIVGEGDCKSTVLTDPTAAADVYTFAHDQILDLVANGALQPVNNPDAIIAANDAGSVAASTVNGTLYAYPATADNGYFMFYNKEYFTEDDVKSLDTMLAKASAAGKYVTIDLDAAWYIYSFFKGAGLDCTLNDDAMTNSCNFNATDTPIKGVDVAQAMLDIAKNPGFINLTDAEFQSGMKDGTVIAGINGVWNANVAKEAWGDNYAATMLPTYTVNGEQVQMGSFAGYKLVGVNAFSANVGWAMKFAEYMTGYDSQMSRFTMRNQGPSNIEASKSEAVQADPAIAALSAQSSMATAQNVGGNYWAPADTFGAIVVAGNPDNIDLQTLVDTMVEGITAPVQ